MSKENIEKFINTYKEVFETSQDTFEWDFKVENNGRVSKKESWIINDLTINSARAKVRLNNFSAYKGCESKFDVLNETWINLIKAEVTRRCFEKKQSALSTAAIVQSLRLIFTVASKPIEELTQLDIKNSYEKALELQPSGLLAGRVLNLSKHLFDAFYLSKYSPIEYKTKRNHKKDLRNREILKQSLDSREQEDKLPDAEAFSELLRILCLKDIRDIDRISFPMIKLLIILGLRIGEVCSIPVNWKTKEIYYDQKGNVSLDKNNKPLMTLYVNYYAEKQGEKGYFQLSKAPVPHAFSDIIEKELDRVVELTKPLRRTLKFQEEHDNSQFFKDEDLNKYMDVHDFTACVASLNDSKTSTQIYAQPRHRFLKNKVPRFKKSNKSPIPWDLPHSHMKEECYLTKDINEAIKSQYKSKLSLIKPKISNGDTVLLKASECLFLIPRETRIRHYFTGTYYDWEKYLFVSPVDNGFLSKMLSTNQTNSNIFYIYTGVERKINTHSFRHLRSTELFRNDISDMIHSKVMNRQSIAQNYEYDHRSLREKLDSLNVSDTAINTMSQNARQVLDKIISGQLGGSVADTFKDIQRKSGSDEAVEWLSAHAEALHLTPYGACVANMISNPCPKHLQCFDNCSHFVADNRKESREQLEQLKQRHIRTLEQLESKPEQSESKKHISHIKEIIKGIDAALNTKKVEFVFPEGVSKFKDLQKPIGKSILDNPVLFKPVKNKQKS